MYTLIKLFTSLHENIAWISSILVAPSYLMTHHGLIFLCLLFWRVIGKFHHTINVSWKNMFILEVCAVMPVCAWLHPLLWRGTQSLYRHVWLHKTCLNLLLRMNLVIGVTVLFISVCCRVFRSIFLDNYAKLADCAHLSVWYINQAAEKILLRWEMEYP